MSQQHTSAIYQTPEYTAVPVVWIEDGDELVHTDATPFCADPTCPCRTDEELFAEFIGIPVKAGLLTEREAKRLFLAEHL